MMPQHRIECYDRYDPKRKLTSYQICKGTQARSSHIYLKEPHSNKWTIAYKSHDRLGYVYYSNRNHKYMFTGVVWSDTRVTHGSNLRGGGPSLGHLMDAVPLAYRITKGIRLEDFVCNDLEKSLPDGLHVLHLPFSGIHSGGTDIVISKQKELDYRNVMTKHGPKTLPDSPATVSHGVCAIEVAGCESRSSKKPVRLTYCGKDFNKWRWDLIRRDVLPVIAWYSDMTAHYVILSDKAYYDAFYVPYRGVMHQQMNHLPSERLQPYVIDGKTLYSRINSLSYPLRDDLMFVYRSYDEYDRN